MKAGLTFVGCCAASILLYLLIFSGVISKPLTVGVYRDMLTVKRDYLRSTSGPHLVLLGGSNVRVSHSAEVLEQELGMPVVNAGLTAAVSLGFAIDSFKSYLKPGDWVYAPIEYPVYRVDLRDEKSDSHYWLPYERASFFRQPLPQLVYGAFSFDLPYAISGLMEMGLQAGGIGRRFSIDTMNDQGDQIGHDDDAAMEYQEVIANWAWSGISTDVIVEDTDTLEQLRSFLRWARENDISVVGGLPTVFDDQPVPDKVRQWIETLYVSEGHYFLQLENRSQYPRDCFFDTPYHLRESCQRSHSELVATGLARLITAEKSDQAAP